MIKKTLCELFESNKAELQQGLSGMTLPKDVDKIQQTVSSYLEKVFDSEGEFRQNLTQSEDYILEAALSLLNAQQKISSTLIKETVNVSVNKKPNTSTSIPEKEESPKINSSHSLFGAAGGAIAGKLLLGGWGAVFGAIAGVAVSVYLSNKQTKIVKPQTKSTLEMLPETEENIPIDVNYFTDIIYSVCESVDNLIGTFRAQINRVVQKYESQEKPTLEKEYRFLLEGIQSLVGYKRNRNTTEEKYTEKLQGRIEDLADLLINYNITLENYSEDKASWFDVVPSPNTTEMKEVFPAVIKNGDLIIPGKVFIPA